MAANSRKASEKDAIKKAGVGRWGTSKLTDHLSKSDDITMYPRS
jgi:hypothetical protein